MRFFQVSIGDESVKTMKHDGVIRSVCFSRDGANIATGGDGTTASVFDVMTGQEIMKTRKHGGLVRAVCFSAGVMLCVMWYVAIVMLYV